MNTHWDKLLEVVEKTRDKVVFFNGDRPYIVMSLDQYESSLGQNKATSLMSEQELIDKINRDIAIWKAQAVTDQEEEVAKSIVGDELETENDEEDDFHIEPVNI